MLDPSILVSASTIPTTVGVSGSGTDLSPDRKALAAATRDLMIAERHAKTLAATIEIQADIDACHQFQSAANTAVRCLGETLPNFQIQIAWRKGRESVCDNVADSSPPETTSNLWVAAAQEISHRGELTLFPSETPANRHSLLAVSQYAKSISAQSIIGVPLIDPNGHNRGALIATTSTGTPDLSAAAAQLQTIAPGLVNKLALLQAIQPGRLQTLLQNTTSAAGAKQRTIAIATTLLTAAALMIPVPYKVSAKCELQPVQRRLIAAPFDGPLASVHVRPGDIVQQGDALATIDPREIDFQLASLNAELRSAVQQKMGLVAEHDFGAVEIANLEARRLQFQQELLQHRRDNLEIRAPLSGMIVTGDLKPSIGSPLTKGDALFELAPLEQMVVEVAIPEWDFAAVSVYMPVEVRLNALPSRKLRGTISHIHPSSVLRDDSSVFLAEVLIANTGGTLRPGMRGRVSVKSDKHLLGWNLFHRAYHRALMLLGW
ncbi:efflux RND transporter periplasmic adaptor subunit [Planctomycetes bacterium K23_9]|uniref:Multidrug resistance protein MdtN n=1 Tax=Stieleria marina TaxID=1930275 RepID=A0A517NY36_9BACT|nr:multidrug resistance protein MdtN [Planctomycetes bacterium K23_9]